MAFDASLPMPATVGPTFAERRDNLRALYSEALADVTERILDEVILPDDKAAFCLDIAQFTAFLMSVKIAEVRGLPPTSTGLLKWFWPLSKAIRDEVPDMLRAFAEQASGSLKS